jgi:hypothetical protein
MKNFKKINSNFCLLVLGLILAFQSCTDKPNPIKISRFDQDLFDSISAKSPEHFLALQKKYPLFYNSFAQDMLNISEEERIDAYEPSLSKFISFPTILQLKHEVDSVYPNLSDIETQLGGAMVIYRKEFPKNVTPQFISFISEFGYANVTFDSIVGIGLDMYLGSDYPLYPALEFPDFMIAKLRRDYIVPNAIKAIAIGKFENQLKDKRFLAMMLFEGKVRYFMKQLLPQLNDSIIFGYSPNQLAWANSNEAQVWSHLIEKKMLFNAEPNQYMRYFNDGPFTIAPGMPQESAPAIGVYIGYKIIEKYMDKQSSVSLNQLMNDANWDKILKECAYKPKF